MQQQQQAEEGGASEPEAPVAPLCCRRRGGRVTGGRFKSMSKFPVSFVPFTNVHFQITTMPPREDIRRRRHDISRLSARLNAGGAVIPAAWCLWLNSPREQLRSPFVLLASETASCSPLLVKHLRVHEAHRAASGSILSRTTAGGVFHRQCYAASCPPPPRGRRRLDGSVGGEPEKS